MACKNCQEKPVITLPNSNVKQCKSCFSRYFEKKVAKTISKYKLIERNDHIIVGASGGKDSTALLFVLKRMQEKMPFTLTALAIDEGIPGYRDKSLEFLKEFCTKHDITLHIESFEKNFQKKLQDLLKGQKPCSVCGVLRRYLMNFYAKKHEATKMATGHNLDDESQTIIMNQCKQNVALQARLGPATGITKDPRFIQRIKPLYFLTEKEIATYAFTKGLMDTWNQCPNERHAFRADIRDTINTLEQKYPGTKHNIVKSFLEILPLLKASQKETGKTINECQECGEPCSQEVCQACKLLKELGVKNVCRDC